MSQFPFWYPGDEVVAWALIVLWQITLVSAIGLLVAHCLGQNPVARYWILHSALFLVLLSPMTALLLRSSRSGCLFVPLAAFRQPGLNEANTTKQLEMAQLAAPKKESAPDFASLAQSHPILASTSDTLSQTRATTATDGAALKWSKPDAPSRASSIGTLLRIAVPPILLLWIIGVVVFLVRLLRGWLQLACIVRNAQPLTDVSINDVIADACSALRGARIPQFVSSPSVTIPIVAGTWNPRVILPEGLPEHISRQQLREILIHEMAHVVRRDQMILLLQNLAAALFWFHTLIRFVNRQLIPASGRIASSIWMLLTTFTVLSFAVLIGHRRIKERHNQTTSSRAKVVLILAYSVFAVGEIASLMWLKNPCLSAIAGIVGLAAILIINGVLLARKLQNERIQQ